MASSLFWFRRRQRKRRVTRLLITVFLVLFLLPVLALAAEHWRHEEPMLICHQKDGDPLRPRLQTDQAPDTDLPLLLCPACLCSHLTQHALPQAGGMPVFDRPVMSDWIVPEDIHDQQRGHAGHAVIRAPPMI
jgi:hypothetical protein